MLDSILFFLALAPLCYAFCWFLVKEHKRQCDFYKKREELYQDIVNKLDILIRGE